MSYEITERIIAINPEDIETLFPQLISQYGEVLPDGGRQVVTIGGHWDNAAKTHIRAASLAGGTIAGQSLTDGRVAFRCLWQSDLAKDFDDGKILGVEELGQEQLEELLPPPPELL
jgi:hypothetical protein